MADSAEGAPEYMRSSTALAFQEPAASFAESEPLPASDSAPLAGFARGTARTEKRRVTGLTATIIVHVVAITLWLAANTVPLQKSVGSLTVVSLAPDETLVEKPVVPEVPLIQAKLLMPEPEFTITLPDDAPMSAAIAPPKNSAPPANVPAEALNSYAAELARHFNRFKRYPALSRRLREQGTAALRFTVDRSGKVLTYSLAKSSGFPVLDEATLEMIRLAQPLPPVPASIVQDPFMAVILIEFSLRNAAR